MTYSKLLAHLVVLLSLSACAQGVWVRPGTSQQEAQMVFAQCDYNATVDTRPSNVHIDSGHHRRNATAHAFGDAIAEGIISGIDEGIRKGDLMRKCMTAQGFFLQSPAQPTSIASRATGEVLSATAKNSTASEQSSKQNLEMTLEAGAKQPLILNTENSKNQAPFASLQLASLQQPQPDFLRNRSEIRSSTPPVTIDQVGLMTTRMMKLPDTSPAKRAFLLGACSAGDITACILSEMN